MKNKFKKLINLNLENVRKIPLTIIFTIIFAFVISINPLLENKYLLNELSYFSKLLILIIVNTFLTGLIVKDKKKKIIGYILSVVIAIFLNNLSSSYLLLKPKCNIDCIRDFSNYMKYVFCGYVILILAISVFNIFRKLKISFSKYINIVLSNIFKIGVIYFVCLLGIMFIFILLEIIVDVDYKVIESIYSLSFGIYVIPSIILSLIDINDSKIGTLFKTINTFCILPVTIISILIIYFYIFKILITKVMPENLIFMFISIVFIIGMISYFCSSDENKIFNIYSTLFPYIFIMPIILQIYSVNIRLIEYGLTPYRYIACMFILLEIITLFLIIYKRGLKIQNILIAISVICVITTVGPLNLVRMSYISQASILNKYYNKTGEQYSKAISAYKYLNQTETGKKYISDKVKNSNIKNDVLNQNYNRNNFKYYYLKSSNENINISDYNNMIPVKITSNPKILLTINTNTNLSIGNIDISEYVNELVDNGYLDSASFSKNNVYKIDNNKTLYIYYLYLKINEENNSVQNIQAKGYLLEK